MVRGLPFARWRPSVGFRVVVAPIILHDLPVLVDRGANGSGRSSKDRHPPPPCDRAALNLALCPRFGRSLALDEQIDDTANADEMPPHSMEAMIRTAWSAGDPKDQLIFDFLRLHVTAGIATTGNQVGSSVDSSGNVHTMRFSRPVEVDVYVDVTLTRDPASYPADGDTQVKAAIARFGNSQLAGVNAVASRLGA